MVRSNRQPKPIWTPVLGLSLLFVLGLVWIRFQSANQPQERNPAPPAVEEFSLQEQGGGRLRSPVGLVYGPGPQGEHRLDHILRHGEDDPQRPVHGVFLGEREEILKLLDDAFGLIQSDSTDVRRRPDGDRTEYTVDFHQPIGFEGGQSGKRNGHPRLNRLRLVILRGNLVITAYPVR